MPSVNTTGKNFAQLEDFNAKKTDEDAEYQRQYMARMAGKVPDEKPAASKKKTQGEDDIAKRKKELQAAAEAAAADAQRNPPQWHDSDDTTRMWNLINADDIEQLASPPCSDGIRLRSRGAQSAPLLSSSLAVRSACCVQSRLHCER